MCCETKHVMIISIVILQEIPVGHLIERIQPTRILVHSSINTWWTGGLILHFKADDLFIMQIQWHLLH